MPLDQYDHQSLEKPVGNKPIYKITYEECRNMVSHMEASFKSDVFGVEKEKGKVEGIMAAVYQSVFGEDIYPSLEEKAANLLYFMIIPRIKTLVINVNPYKGNKIDCFCVVNCR